MDLTPEAQWISQLVNLMNLNITFPQLSSLNKYVLFTMVLVSVACFKILKQFANIN